MTFNVNDPAPSDKIRNWPSSVTTNEWPRLKAMIEADHVFNDAAGGAPDTSGWHKVARWINQAVTPAAITGHGQLYTKDAAGFSGTTSEHLAYGAGTSPLTYPECFLSLFPVRAACIFTGTDPVGAQTLIGTPYNITSVNRTATGLYTVTFTSALPSGDYIALATQVGNNNVWAQMAPGPTAASFVLVGQDRNNLANFTQCRLLVFGG